MPAGATILTMALLVGSASFVIGSMWASSGYEVRILEVQGAFEAGVRDGMDLFDPRPGVLLWEEPELNDAWRRGHALGRALAWRGTAA